MRILLLGHAPSIHTRRWAAALHSRGHDLRLLSAHEPATALPVPVRKIGKGWPIHALRYWSARGEVREEIRSFRPEVTVAHFVPNYGFLAALAGATPWMLVAWGSDLLVNATRTPLHRARARWTLRKASLVHVDAGVLAKAAVRLGADPGRVWTRPWGIDVDAYAPGGPWAARRAEGRPLRVLWTRQLEPVYDPGTFLRALGLLAKTSVPFRATLAGSGPLRPALEATARREGIDRFVTFAGWVEPSELLALYREHEVYVSLSRSDSTSQSLLEAMAAGLVPVLSDIEGNREWVRHRREGLLVPTEDPEAVACALAEVARGAAAGVLSDGARAAVLERARFADTLAETETRLMALAAASPIASGLVSGRLR